MSVSVFFSFCVHLSVSIFLLLFVWNCWFLSFLSLFLSVMVSVSNSAAQAEWEQQWGAGVTGPLLLPLQPLNHLLLLLFPLLPSSCKKRPWTAKEDHYCHHSCALQVGSCPLFCLAKKYSDQDSKIWMPEYCIFPKGTHFFIDIIMSLCFRILTNLGYQ